LLDPWLAFQSHLSAEVADEYKQRLADNADATPDQLKDVLADLSTIASSIIPYFMAHNAEAEACDLLMEVRLVDNRKNKNP
jgi:26S proteasome regulatory subunit N1